MVLRRWIAHSERLLLDERDPERRRQIGRHWRWCLRRLADWRASGMAA
jgi:hypothetical protein